MVFQKLYGLINGKKGAAMAFVVLALIALVGILSPIITKHDDSVTEELSEQIIEDATGVKFDFTPDSVEDD